MELNGIQPTTQSNYANETPAVKKDADQKALFGYGFKDAGKTKGEIDLADFDNPEVAQKAKEQGLIGKNVNDVNAQKQLAEIYRQSTDKTEVLEYYDKENGYRVYSRENLEDGSSVTIVTNEKQGLQQEIKIDSDLLRTVKNYQLNPNGDPVEIKDFLISNTATGKIYTLNDLEKELNGEGNPDFEIELFLEETAIPNHINFDSENESIEILLFENGTEPTALTLKDGHLKCEKD